MAPRAFITGSAGLSLTADERAFVREADPWGFILFKRNIETPDQVFRLVQSFRDLVGRGDAPVLIDQEGGRVARLGPPHWPSYPPGAVYGALYDQDQARGLAAARLAGRLIGADLRAVGINVDCLPLADVPVSGADPVIGDRAYGTKPDKVAAIACAITQGLREAGVLPVLKHIPGHGRANADSHLRLPVVEVDRALLEATDFMAFRPLAGLPMAMTAHVVFTAIDPAGPATSSPKVIGEIIRGFIGFTGLLMSDDISMEALSGGLGERARAALDAGCDIVLHCNGKLDEMQAIANVTPTLSGLHEERAAAAFACGRKPSAIDLDAARAEFSAMVRHVKNRIPG